MNEYNRWSKIEPISERFLRYSNYYNWGKNRKLYLLDVLNKDLEGSEYFNLCVELALKGYKLNLIEGNRKLKIGVGIERLRMYSYFELIPGELLLKLEQIKNMNNEREQKIVTDLINIEKEYSKIKKRKKADRRVLIINMLLIKYSAYILKENQWKVLPSILMMKV